MLTIVNGDLFTTEASTLVITVNTVGAMGKGIALTFKERYPEYYEVYRKACRANEVAVGKMMLLEGIDERRFILFPTKEHFKYPSKLQWIESGLLQLVEYIDRFSITDIALPPLGCGNGKLDFNRQVKPLMEHHLHPLRIPCQVYL